MFDKLDEMRVECLHCNKTHILYVAETEQYWPLIDLRPCHTISSTFHRRRWLLTLQIWRQREHR